MLTLVYSQTLGIITTTVGELIADVAWAGHGIGKNDPAYQTEHGVGPLPQGLYECGEWEESHPGLGPLVCKLTQIEGETFGRDGFYIHGPAKSAERFGEESKGCIIVPRVNRDKIAKMKPDFIRVAA